MPVHGDGASGAAKRRRERRLRSWWRHEAQSVQAAVVSALHHSRDVGPAKNEALRGQKKTTEVEEAGLETHSGLRAPTPLPPGMRPASLAEPGAQERVQRHTVEHLADGAPGLPMLDVPAPQMVDQPVAVLARFDLPIPEQVIEVPRRFSRTALRSLRMAEQLVEVPLPAMGVVQAWVRDANGQRWSRVWDSTGRIYWWHQDSDHVQWNTPLVITASPGRYINTGQGGCFYEPLYLAVSCLTPCLPEEYLRGLFWETTSGGIPYSAAFGSTVVTWSASLRRLQFFRASSTRCPSVGSSLSVAVLRYFAWLVSRRTVPVHRRCHGSVSCPRCRWQFCVILLGSGSHRRCHRVLSWMHVHVSLRGVLENFTFSPYSVQCWLRQWIRVLRHLWRILAVFTLFCVKSGLPILRFMIPLGFIA